MNSISETGCSRSDAFGGDEIEVSDISPLTHDFFLRATWRLPKERAIMSVIDAIVLPHTEPPLRARLSLSQDRIDEICRKYDVTELAVFGSILRDNFRPDSDVDFLVTFRENDAGPWMSKFLGLQDELAALLGRNVDIVDKMGIEQSRNWIRRKSILDSAEVIYAGGVTSRTCCT